MIATPLWIHHLNIPTKTLRTKLNYFKECLGSALADG
jgi:hypothetical protein